MGLTLILGILKRFWPYILVALVLASIYGYWHHLTSTIRDQQQTIAERTVERDTAVANFHTIHNVLDIMNGTLGELSKNAAATDKTFQILNKNLGQQSKTISKNLANILNEKKPVTCEDAIKYLKDAVKDYQ